MAVAVLLVLAGPGADPVAAEVVYQPPVPDPVSDPFRPPAHFAGPGNRGLEYRTAPGVAVRAAADGTVVFAGPVGGELHVTVRHADGIRTSYSWVASVSVAVGDQVERGQVLAVSGGVVHLGARRGDVYIDPAALFAPHGVRLVPVGAGAGGGADPSAGVLRGMLELAATVDALADRLRLWAR